MNAIASIVVTLGLIVSLNGDIGYQRDLANALDLLLIYPDSDVSAAEARSLYPLNPERTLQAKLFLAAYVVTRQVLQPADDYAARLRSLRVEPPPGYSPTAAAQQLNDIIDLVLAGRMENEAASMLLLRMQPVRGT